MTLVVGWGPQKQDPGPLHLAATLARSAGQDLRVVAVVPAPWPTPLSGGADQEYAAWSRELGSRAVAASQDLLAEYCPDVPSTVVAAPGTSAARTLTEEAQRVDAAMVVVGSASHGSWGSVVVGSTADRLLHSSPVPVALATRGYRSGPGATVTRATCSFRGDAASAGVLERTAVICAEVGAALRVVTFGVRGRTMYPPEVLGEAEVLDSYVRHTAALQEKAVASLAVPHGEVETAVATGRSWAEALEDVDWEAGDVLVVGSSSAGLVSRLFLGSNATKIIRSSPVPVVVVP